jgi:predicted anti-sigma-YlaC factor YlaD
MHRCKDCERLLPEFIAQRTTSDDPLPERYWPIIEHLRECPSCRALADELWMVESALRQQPRVRPAPTLHTRIMRRVEASLPMETESWNLLPRDIWIPAALFCLVLCIALLATPSYLYSGQVAGQLEPTIGYWPDELIQLGNGMIARVQEQGFWIAWTTLFAILTALGVRLTVLNWREEHAQSVQHMEHLLMDKASRLWNSARRAH